MRCCCHHGDCCLLVFIQGDREQDRGWPSSGESWYLKVSVLFLLAGKQSHKLRETIRSVNSLLFPNHAKWDFHESPHVLPFTSHLSLSALWLHDASAGTGLGGGGERGGSAVPDYFSGDSWRCECRIRSRSKMWWVLPWSILHPSTKFCGILSSSFYIILFTDKLTSTDGNRTLVEVKCKCVKNSMTNKSFFTAAVYLNVKWVM